MKHIIETLLASWLPLLIGLVIGLAVFVSFNNIETLRNLEDSIFDSFLRTRNPDAEESQVAVLAIDDWDDLSRKNIAELLLLLAQKGARVVALDIFLTEKGRIRNEVLESCIKGGAPSANLVDIVTQQATARQLATGGQLADVVLGMDLHNETLPKRCLANELQPDTYVSATQASIADRYRIPEFQCVNSALDRTLTTAPHGFLMNPRTTGTVRFVSMIVAQGESFYPSLALLAAQLFDAIHAKAHKAVGLMLHPGPILQNGETRIPIDSSGQLRVAFRKDDSGWIQTLSRQDLASLSSQALAGKVVFVGVTDPYSEGGGHHTPVGTLSGVMIQAHAAASLLSGKFLRSRGQRENQVSLWASVLIALITCFVATTSPETWRELVPWFRPMEVKDIPLHWKTRCFICLGLMVTWVLVCLLLAKYSSLHWQVSAPVLAGLLSLSYSLSLVLRSKELEMEQVERHAARLVESDAFKRWAGTDSFFTTVAVDVAESLPKIAKQLGRSASMLRFLFQGHMLKSIEKYNGKVVGKLGDGVWLAFKQPEAALDFSFDIFEDSGHSAIQVRIGISSGNYSLNQGKAVGSLLTRVARIRDFHSRIGITIDAGTRRALDEIPMLEHQKRRWSHFRDVRTGSKKDSIEHLWYWTDQSSLAPDSSNPTVGKPVSIFVAFDKADSGFKEDLDRALVAMKHNRHVDSWDDSQVYAGDDHEQSLKDAIDRCDLAILLISPNFLASELLNLVPQMMERRDLGEIRVIPIILRSCEWDQFELFQGLKVLPNKEEALAEYQTENDERGKVWLEVAREIQRHVIDLRY